METYAETATEAFGRRFVQALCEEDQRLVPELVSRSESYKDPFIDLDHFLANWWATPVKMYEDDRFIGERFAGPMWIRRSNLVSRGHVNHGLVRIDYSKSSSKIWYQCRWSKDVDFSHLFDAWVSLAHPEVGMLHLFTEPELRKRDAEPDRSFWVGSFGGPAKPGLPNIGWAMAYGKSYAAEVDVARIRTAGFPVDQNAGVLIVRVTEKLSDVVDDFPYFSRRRAELKTLFRPGLFWVVEEPSELPSSKTPIGLG